MRILNISALVLSLGLISNSVNAAYSNLYAFGDSLSDSGNVPSPYASGRASNGPVWVERLATKLGLNANPSFYGGTNFSIAGGRTGPSGGFPPTVIDQVNSYTATNTADASALYSIWGGGNDIRDAAQLALGFDFAGANAMISDAVTNIAASITSLHLAGAVNFIVPNAPNLGLIPEVNVFGPIAMNGVTSLSQTFNNLLTASLSSLQTTLSINITTVDVFSLTNDMVNNPAANGFTNVVDACYNGAACANPDEYLFWDSIHPTTAGHKIIANQAFSDLGAVPLPATIWLMITALSGLTLLSKRHKA